MNEDVNPSDLARTLGKRGGEKTLQKYGTEHFKALINKRWSKRQNAPKTHRKTSP